MLPIIDTHTDLVLTYQNLGKKFGQATHDTQSSLALMKQAGIKIVFAGFSYDDWLGNSNQQLDDTFRMINNYPDDLVLITDFKQVSKVLQSNRIGVVLHLEGAKILEGDMNRLVDLYIKGLRSIGLTHNTKNSLGTGAVINSTDSLTNFGKQVIQKCNQLNILVDLSHLNEAGFYEAVVISKKPVIVSHAACFSISPHPRNIKDDQLKKIAEIDSVVGIYFSGKYVNPELVGSRATIKDAVLQIKHMVDIMGVDHLAIGSDFGGITSGVPKGLENHAKLTGLFEALKKDGFSTEDLEKIAYKNFLRIIQSYT